jgi:hypothetical protein
MDLLTRAKTIRLPVTEIARRAGLDKHTVLRLRIPGRAPLTSTRDAVTREIEAEEIQLRDYLVGLHGAPDTERAS